MLTVAIEFRLSYRRLCLTEQYNQIGKRRVIYIIKRNAESCTADKPCITAQHYVKVNWPIKTDFDTKIRQYKTLNITTMHL